MAITAPDRIGTVTLTIDGGEVTAIEGSTIWAAPKAAGIDIPVLCHDERYDPVGVCRMCVVDVDAPAFAASCVRACESGMQVKTGPRRSSAAAPCSPKCSWPTSPTASTTPSSPPPLTTNCSPWPTASG